MAIDEQWQIRSRHLVEIDAETETITIYRVHQEESVLLTHLPFASAGLQEAQSARAAQADPFGALAARLGETLLLDSPPAQRLVDG